MDAKPAGKDPKKPASAQAGKAQPTPQQPRARGMEKWQDLISEQLEKAIGQGAFDNLPGAGKPLDLNENPNEPADMRMANKLLKDNNLSPAWIGDRKKLLADCDLLRAEILREWQWLAGRLATADADRTALQAGWARSLSRWEERIADLNRRILDLNLILPIWRMELVRLRLDDELARIGAGRALPG